MLEEFLLLGRNEMMFGPILLLKGAEMCHKLSNNLFIQASGSLNLHRVFYKQKKLRQTLRFYHGKKKIMKGGEKNGRKSQRFSLWNGI